MPDTTRVAVELDVLHFARLPTPYDYAHRPPGRGLRRWITGFRAGPDALDVPCLAFVLRHPSEGVVLVDTGLHPASHESVADFGPAMRLVFRGLKPVGPPYGEQLRALGVAPDDVRNVVMTHLHVDHTSGMRSLPIASFVCSQQEWAAARAPRAALKGYVAAHLPGRDRMQLVDVERDGIPRGPFLRTLDLFADGSIHLIATPGHTPGHLSVLIQTSAHDEVLLVGDAAYTTRNIAEGILPLLTDDDTASLESLRQLHEFSTAASNAPLIPSHDPAAWRRLLAKGASVG